MIKLSRLNDFWDEQLGVTTLEILNRCTLGLAKEKAASLGKQWQVFEDIRKTLGDLEFEIFIQANLEARKEAVKKRGFYPSILLDDDSDAHYLNRRQQIFDLWGNPSLRFKNPLFSKLYPMECKLTEEYWGRGLKTKTPDYKECVEYITATASGEWLTAMYSYEESEKLDPIPQSRFMAALADSKRRHWDKELAPQKLKAEIFACLTEGNKILGPKAKSMEVDETSNQPLCVLLLPQILSLASPIIDRGFNVVDHEE
jgi:hypothetical protein